MYREKWLISCFSCTY